MKILLVESAPWTDDVVPYLEDQRGWSVGTLASVGEVAEALDEAPVDAVVAGWDLPDGTGLDVLDVVQREAVGTPLVLVTDGADVSDAWKAVTQGAASVVERGPHFEAALADEVERVAEALEGLGPLAVVDLEEEPAAVDVGPDLGSLTGEDPEDLVRELVTGPVGGALMLGPDGEALAGRMPDGVDADAVTRRAVEVSRNVEALGRAADTPSRGYVLLVDSPEGVLGVSTIPGPRTMVLLLEPGVGGGDALALLVEASRDAWDRLAD